MSRIQEIVNLGSETDNILSIIVDTISELDWIVQEKEINMVKFREKRRFDHFNHVEGRISFETGNFDTELNIDIWNSGIGTLQDNYLKGKLSELMVLLKYNYDQEINEMELEDLHKDGNLADEMESLSRLHRKGELSDLEFQIAKTKLLHGNDSS